MKQLLIFDLDDTLIETHSVFLRITNEILARMEDEGIIDDNLYYTFDSFDQEMVEETGSFKLELFAKAAEKTYDFYCQKLNLEYKDETAMELMEIAWQIKTAEHRLVDGAKDLLDELWNDDDFTMVLVTRGDEDSQRQKIKNSGLKHYFAETYVVENKTPQVYAEIMRLHGFEPSASWIIGNSIRAEIMPAKALGANCILTAVTEETWGYENVETEIDCPQVTKLADCLNILYKK